MLSGIRKPTIRNNIDAIRARLQNNTNEWLAYQYNNRNGLLRTNSDNWRAALVAEVESRKVNGKLPAEDEAPKDEVPKDEAPKDQNGFLDGKKIVGYERQSCGGKGQVIMVPILEKQAADDA